MADGRYLEVNGTQTWVLGDLAEDAVVHLHGGLHHSEGFLPALVPVLPRYRHVAYDRPSLGHTADPGGDLHFSDFTDHAIGVLEKLGGQSRRLIGFSDGGVVALQVALKRPDLISAMVLIGARYSPDSSEPTGLSPGDEHYQMLEREHAEQSPDGPGRFASVVERHFHMWRTEPNLTLGELATVRTPTLIVTGDQDLVTPDYTNSMFQALPNAQLAILPNAGHGVAWEKAELVARMIEDFFDWVETQQPA